MAISEILIKAAQLILSLAFLVTIHEFGHFIPARLFKTKVEKFYLFFNPWFSLLRYKKVNGHKKFSWFSKKAPQDWDQDENTTEWGIGWLPLGGYVKIAGMVDESMDKDQLAQEPKPYEFRTKKVWQRLIIMVGGVTVNLIGGFLIYAAIAWTWGGYALNLDKMQHGMAIHPYLEQYDIISGDKILALDGKPVVAMEDINRGIFLRNKTQVTLLRHGKVIKRSLPDDIDQRLFQQGAMGIASFRAFTSSVDSIVPKSHAEKAGLMKGDSILMVGDKAIRFFDQLQSALYSSKGAKTRLRVLRGTDTLELSTRVSDEGTIGFLSLNIPTSDTNALSKVSYGFLGGLEKGVVGGSQMLCDYIAQFKFLFTKKGASSVGGFTRIGDMFAPVWDWKVFWLNTAFLSFALAFMNILPIPALDGGHVVFLMYEWITGKEAPQKILEYAQYIGFFLLLSLMIYANGNDIVHLIFK
ncbi:MAG: RIP metalloprotease RseP [Bacteroidota bacterium]